MTPTVRRLCSFSLFAAASLPVPAFAQLTAQDHATAYALFEQGRVLAKTGHFGEACPKFEESQRLDPGIGTLFNLADCYEHIGRTASAWSNFREVADSAAHSGQTVRAKTASDRAEALVSRLAHLTVAASGDGSAVQLRLDTTVMGAGALGVALPIDPGTHTLSASAPGKKTWASSVEIADGASVSVSLPTLENEATPVAAPVTPAARAMPEPVLVPITESDRREPVRPFQRPVGMAMTGVGVVGVGLGAFFGLRASSKWSSAEPSCPSSGCTGAGYQSWQDARSAAKVSTVLFVAGGAVLTAGVVLWITAPSAPADVRVGLSRDRLVLGGAF